ncbi:MAG: DNA integrity scanning diadenylate cyclase DisA [Coriobacteriia bacterium]|nr:DNA integrity scanning diadenylate cyclase DisA [Coriobacteriia bacterium]
MEPMQEDTMLSALKSVAPGTPLRQALEYIIAARTGALIVIGDVNGVDAISNGGFEIGAPFTPQRLFELAKMDGAILLDEGATRIRRANTHLVPDADLPTNETGMRHRTAERVSRQTDALVISVSQRREVVSLYHKGTQLMLEDIDVVLAKANQALQTLQRYRARLDEVSAHLTALEFEDVVTFGEATVVIQRAEMLRRVAREVHRHVTELGTEGRLVQMQADELTAGVDDDYTMLVRDYLPDGSARKASTALGKLGALLPDQLLDSAAIAVALGHSAKTDMEEQRVEPRGYRLLRRIPQLPGTVINRLVERFGTLRALMEASESELDDVDGVGARRAQAISDGLRRMRDRAVL